jgi:putative monooxygenase ydhR
VSRIAIQSEMKALLTTIRPPEWDLAEVMRRCESGVGGYRDVPGLRHKTYWVSDAQQAHGGIYLFEDAGSLERFMRSRRYRVEIPRIWEVEPEAWVVDVPFVVDNDLDDDRAIAVGAIAGVER